VAFALAEFKRWVGGLVGGSSSGELPFLRAGDILPTRDLLFSSLSLEIRRLSNDILFDGDWVAFDLA